MSPTIDHLFLQSDLDYSEVPFVSVHGYVQGAEQLRVVPALWIHNADRLLQLLDVFGGCTVTELTLDLRRITARMDGEFWKLFFIALPNIRRLELLSCSVESREIKQAIAEHFLASSSCRNPQRISLAWALHAVERDKVAQHSWMKSLTTSNAS